MRIIFLQSRPTRISTDLRWWFVRSIDLSQPHANKQSTKTMCNDIPRHRKGAEVTLYVKPWRLHPNSLVTLPWQLVPWQVHRYTQPWWPGPVSMVPWHLQLGPLPWPPLPISFAPETFTRNIGAFAPWRPASLTLPVTLVPCTFSPLPTLAALCPRAQALWRCLGTFLHARWRKSNRKYRNKRKELIVCTWLNLFAVRLKSFIFVLTRHCWFFTSLSCGTSASEPSDATIKRISAERNRNILPNKNADTIKDGSRPFVARGQFN